MMECGLTASSDTSETTVLSEQTGKVTATVAPIHDHLGQTPSECSQEFLLRPAHHSLPGGGLQHSPGRSTTCSGERFWGICSRKSSNFLMENPRPRGLESGEQQAAGCSSLPACSSPFVLQGSAWAHPPPGSLPGGLQSTLASFPNSSPML